MRAVNPPPRRTIRPSSPAGHGESGRTTRSYCCDGPPSGWHRPEASTCAGLSVQIAPRFGENLRLQPGGSCRAASIRSRRTEICGISRQSLHPLYGPLLTASSPIRGFVVPSVKRGRNCGTISCFEGRRLSRCVPTGRFRDQVTHPSSVCPAAAAEISKPPADIAPPARLPRLSRPFAPSGGTTTWTETVPTSRQKKRNRDATRRNPASDRSEAVTVPTASGDQSARATTRPAALPKFLDVAPEARPTVTLALGTHASWNPPAASIRTAAHHTLTDASPLTASRPPV